jgi:hypothetical protein
VPRARAELTRGAGEVAASMQKVVNLRTYFDDASLPPDVRDACWDSWMTHTRVLIEFLTKRGKATDIRRLDYAPQVPVPDGSRVDILHERWLDASQTVAHLSWERITPTRPVGNVLPAVLDVITELILEFADSFICQLETAGHPDAAIFRSAMA